MPIEKLTPVPIEPDGVRLAIPARDADLQDGLTVEIGGVIRCAYNGKAYDGVYECNLADAADTGRPHSYLSWQPYAPSLIEQDTREHRYRFRFAKLARGVLPSVRVDIDRFVDDFLISPSEVRGSLTGRFMITRVEGAPFALPWHYALAAAPALVLTGAAAWVIRRRMTASVLDYDLVAQLHRIREKAAAAQRAVRNEDRQLVAVRERVKVLENGAHHLARQIQQIRTGRGLHNRAQLERDAKLLAQRASVEPSNEELLETLLVKRKSLEQLAELEQSEHGLADRLSKIEAVLENALAGLQNVRTSNMADPVRNSVCQALDSEVAALREATQLQPDAAILGRSRV